MSPNILLSVGTVLTICLWFAFGASTKITTDFRSVLHFVFVLPFETHNPHRKANFRKAFCKPAVTVVRLLLARVKMAAAIGGSRHFSSPRHTLGRPDQLGQRRTVHSLHSVLCTFSDFSHYLDLEHEEPERFRILFLSTSHSRLLRPARDMLYTCGVI